MSVTVRLRLAVVALAVVTIGLLAAVLPAVYGIDPLGTGRRLGLLKRPVSTTAAPAATPVAPPPPPADVPVQPPPPPAGRYFPQRTEARVDAKEFSVGPFGDLEMGYVLDKDASLIYSWESTAPLSFDFHTDPAGNPDASDSFEIASASEGRGGYVAPYAGIHGWYWKNTTVEEVTVRVTVTGFFSSVVLYNEDGTTQSLPITPPKRVAPGGRR